ncbi:MAG: hypothetical protein EOO27_05200 [Comamonadaceae bacterium]|nr:MAG: hypothetical protein EOO27_05200 [Comamonadaceae bacterium]
MTKLNTGLLIIQATANLKRADEVRKEPAVVKAATQFRDDAKAAADSGAALMREAQAAWKRAG